MIYSKGWHRSADLLGAAFLTLQWQVKVDVQCPEIRLLVKVPNPQLGCLMESQITEGCAPNAEIRFEEEDLKYISRIKSIEYRFFSSVKL